MPSPLSNPGGWTLRRLLTNSYAHQESRTRFKYQLRDMVKVIRIEKTLVYDGKNPGEARTKFLIRTQSTMQYSPYFTKRDARGRPRKRQIKFRHQYEVTIQLDKLSLDTPFKARVGSQGRWDFSPRGKDHRIKQNRTFKIIPGTNSIRGRNGDFFFRCEWVWHKEKILFGRDWTNGHPPVHTNPKQIVFAPKHFLSCVEYLMNTGKLK
jgi:hypothetical protein